MDFTRRHLIMLSGVALAAFGGGFYAGSLPQHGPYMRDMLVALLKDPESAAMAGRAWFKTSGVSELDSNALALRLARRLRLQGWSGEEDDSLRTALQKSIRNDFDTDDMVDVAGWQFARTSAELCALAALSSIEPVTPET